MLRFPAVFALQASLIFLGGLYALGQDVREHSWGDSSVVVLQREKITLEKGPEQYPRCLELVGEGEIMGANAEIKYIFFDDKLCRAQVIWQSNFKSERACLALIDKFGKPRVSLPIHGPVDFMSWRTPRIDVRVHWKPVEVGRIGGVVLWDSRVKPTWETTEFYIKAEKLLSDSKDF